MILLPPQGIITSLIPKGDTEVEHKMNQRRYKPKLDRAQRLLLPDRVEDYVGENHQVRALDAYVNTLDLAALGFKHTETGTIAGQPPYNPWALLKLYLYGYQHGIRSSRKLEAETRRNLEVIWLVEGLQPSYKSIADFRKDHVRQLREVTRDFVLLCRELSLFGGEVVAVDGSFFKADASKKSIQTKAYIDKALEKIDEKIEEYHQILDRQDAADEKAGARDTSNDEVLSEKIEKMKRKQAEKRDIKARIERSGDSQASMTDKDARLLKKSAQAIPGYNAQIVVDSKHKLVVAEDVSNNGDDRTHLAHMLVEAKRRLDVEELTGLADRGYYDGAQFKECEDKNITVYVPSPDKSLAMKKKGRYSKKDFTYDARGDCYYCPQGKQLKRCKATVTKNSRTYVQYISKSVDCKACAVREHCLGAQRRTRILRRWEHEDVVDRHRERVRRGGEKVKKRGAIVEHPFGTLKHRSGLHQFLMRGLKKCRGEFSLMVAAYNFTRVLNILGVEKFREFCVGRRLQGPQIA